MREAVPNQNFNTEEDTNKILIGRTEEERAIKERNNRKARKLKRDEEIRSIRNQKQDKDELDTIRSQTSKHEDGAFCTTLFTVCFLVHFFLEFGSSITGSQFAMQTVISDHFEARILNLDNFTLETSELLMMGDI